MKKYKVINYQTNGIIQDKSLTKDIITMFESGKTILKIGEFTVSLFSNDEIDDVVILRVVVNRYNDNPYGI